MTTDAAERSSFEDRQIGLAELLSKHIPMWTPSEVERSLSVLNEPC